ncbi:MAG TPA: hypothetical protein VMY42_23105 [Thermoguttaceae bacterium]|nr:hypothetical protein [Thermoguttaceae bacterium]
MKGAVLGALVGAGLVLAVAGGLEHRNEVFAQRMTSYEQPGENGGLIALSSPAADKGQLITVIDPKQRAMSVYRVDSVTGKIALCSVRNIHWDLQMIYLNNESPFPQEIRSLLEQR